MPTKYFRFISTYVTSYAFITLNRQFRSSCSWCTFEFLFWKVTSLDFHYSRHHPLLRTLLIWLESCCCCASVHGYEIRTFFWWRLVWNYSLIICTGKHQHKLSSAQRYLQYLRSRRKNCKLFLCGGTHLGRWWRCSKKLC
jgi:hypothetical protein